MSEVKLFPLIESVGLTVDPQSTIRHGHADLYREDTVSAALVEQLLSRGVRVFGLDKESMWDAVKGPQDRNTALLIDIKPIAKPERRRELSESEVREALRDACPSSWRDEVVERLFGAKGGV